MPRAQKIRWRLYVFSAFFVACGTAGNRAPELPEPSSNVRTESLDEASGSELPPLIPGTTVRLVPPAGFAPADTFTGYQQLETGGSVLVHRR